MDCKQARVAAYANQRECSEWDVMKRAFEWWFNKTPTLSEMRRHFHLYLSSGHVPTFVVLYLDHKADATIEI